MVNQPARLVVDLQNRHVAGVNQLRIGTAILMGGINSHTGFQHAPGFHEDAFALEAELIEVKQGKRAIGILALGKQDTDPQYLYPVSREIKILDAGSDHTVVDLGSLGSTSRPGDTISFYPGYYALSRLMVSPYVGVTYRSPCDTAGIQEPGDPEPVR